MNPDLFQYCIQQLAAHQGSWPEIARQCGVSYSWLCKLANNKLPDVGYKRLNRLANYLEVKTAESEGERRKSERRTKERKSN